MSSSLLVAVLAAADLCVPHTDVCGPPGATLTGAVHFAMGGRVTITAGRPVRALGADFSSPVVVDVQRWGSSDGTRGSLVRVEGALHAPRKVAGVPLAGRVALMQAQGPGPARPVLVGLATLEQPGRLELPGLEPIALGAGARISGHLDMSGADVRLSAAAPVRVSELDFAAGEVRVLASTARRRLSGTLTHPQRVGDVEASGELAVEWEGPAIRFRQVTVTKATPLERVLGVNGTLPAGATVFAHTPEILVRAPQPLIVAGVALAGTRGANGTPTVTFRRVDSRYAAWGEAPPGGSTVDGLALRLGIALEDVEGSTIGRVQGTLDAPVTRLGARFAAGKTLKATVAAEPAWVRGTLAEPQQLAGLWVKGETMLEATDAGVRVTEATLARPSRFEGWTLPAGTELKYRPGNWSFTTPPKSPARVAAGSGEVVDFVASAHRDDQYTSFELAQPWTSKDTGLTVPRHLGRTSDGACWTAQVSSGRSGIFGFPAGSTASWCGSRVVGASGSHAETVLQVGRWFATHAVAGEPSGTPPTRHEASRQRPSDAPGSGYWLQVLPACAVPSGIPQPPPAERWLFVDPRGEPTSEADREALEALASKRGGRCPEVKCCVP